MVNDLPTISLCARIAVLRPKVVGENGREFSCFPAAILVIVVNADDDVLLFSKNANDWEVVAGGIEDHETILDAALRELKEEAGDDVLVDPIGVVHAHTFHYDKVVRNMISIYYVVRYLGGEVVPGDDMVGAEYDWKPLSEIRESDLAIPAGQKWILERAVMLASNCEGQYASLEYFAERGE